MTDPKKRLIPVFAGPRSGSNYLIDLLAKVPGIVALSEVFNPSGVYGLNLFPRIQQQLMAEAGSDDALFELFRMEPERAVALMLQAIPADKRLVVKIHPHQVHGAAMRRILTRHATGAAILVRRRLDQFVSLEKALAKQTWFKADTTELRPEISSQAFLSWSALMDDWIAQTESLCRDTNLPVSWLDYDADLKSGDEDSLVDTLTSRLAELGVAVARDQVTIKSGFTRQDLSEETFQKFANGADLKADLVGLGCLDYALSAQSQAPIPVPPSPIEAPDLIQDPTCATDLLREGQFDKVRAGLTPPEIKRTCGNVRIEGDDDIGLFTVTFLCGLCHPELTQLHDHLATRYDLTVLDPAETSGDRSPLSVDPDLIAFDPPMTPSAPADRLWAESQATKMRRDWAAQAVDPTHPHLLQASVQNVTRIAYLRSLYPDARFVLLVRDPRSMFDVLHAKRPEISADMFLAHWHLAHMTALHQLDAGCMVLRYEDYLASPTAELRRIAAFCELTPRPGAHQRLASAGTESADLLASATDWASQTRGFDPQIKAWTLFGYSF